MNKLRLLFLAAIVSLIAGTAYSQTAVRFNNATGAVTDPIKLPSTKAVLNNSTLAALVTPGSAVYYTGSAWALARADALATARVDAIVESVTTPNVVLVYAGEITLSGLTAGSTYYLSSTTAGTRTTTAPSTAGTYRVPLFTATATTKALVNISPDLVSNNPLANADLATMPAGTVKANLTGAAAVPTDTSLTTFAAALAASLTSKQDTLVSGTNIKTLNSQSLLGSGNIVVSDAASQTGTVAAPNTSTPLSPTWSSSCHIIYVGVTGTVNLPAAAGYSGKGLILRFRGSYVVTVDPSASEVIERDGTLQTGGVSVIVTGTAGQQAVFTSDGTSWSTLGSTATLTVGS